MLKKPILNTIVQVIGKGATVFISLLTTSLLTRKLGAAVYGEYTLITSVFIFLDSLADFGTKIIGVREMAAKENENAGLNIWKQTVWFRIIMAGVAFLVGLGIIIGWSGFKSIQTEAFLALIMLWFTSIAGSLEIIWQVKLRMDVKVLIEILFPLLFLIGLRIHGTNINLVWVFSAYLVARIISLGLGLAAARKIGKIEWIGSLRWQTVKMLFKETWPMGMYLIIFASYDRGIDSLLIQKYIGSTELAWYGLAYKIYATLLQPAYFYVISIFPIMAAKDTHKRKLFVWSWLILAVGLVVVVPMVYFLAPWIINTLAGSEYGASVAVLRVLLAALVFSYLGHLSGFTLISKKGQKEMLGLGLTSLAVNTAANLWTVPRFGIMGAAWVTVTTEATACLLMTYRLWKISKRS